MKFIVSSRQFYQLYKKCVWSHHWILPGLGQSSSPTTYLDFFLRPSRKVTTRSRMSSALLEVNVYSSPLMVANVKLWPWSLPPLEYHIF